jgi:hypothetical protein
LSISFNFFGIYNWTTARVSAGRISIIQKTTPISDMEDDHPLSCPPPTNDLWNKEIDTLIKAIDEGLSGKKRHIAIISEYLAGKQDLCKKIECVHSGRCTRIRLNSFVDDLSIFAYLPESDIYIIDNCHFLARRKIDGFHVLHQFIEMVSQSKRIWVTTWNIHSWRYLTAVQKFNLLFPVQILLYPKNYDKLRDYILSEHQSSVFYLVDTPVPRRLILVKKLKKIHIPFLPDDFFITTYSIRYRLIWAIIRGKSHEVEPDELIFQRLAQISNGNPGVATRIWEKSLDAWEIRMSALSPPLLNGGLDPDSAYILSLILSLEVLTLEDLYSVTPQGINIDLVLVQLEENKLIQIKDGLIFIVPLALTKITTELQKIRMVW